ncbi:MAG: M48 family metallopeptidase, partial [Eubacterium sp.]|nr:M48 family metallopeptidase [Eubacterium sp.]
TINFRLKSDCMLYISANTRVPEKYIRELISANSENFLKAMAEIREKAAQKSRAAKEEENSFYYLGKRYDIEIIPSGKNYCVLKDKLYVYAENSEGYALALQKFIQDETKRIYCDVVNKTYNMLKADGTPYPAKISVKKMTSRWGSCTPSKRNISLNVELIKYPIGCLEYVVLHEFTHFHIAAHNKDFYAYVEKYMKDYKTYRNILKKPYYEVSEQ